MNPTVKLFFSAIGSLCIAIIRFILACFYGITKLLSAICQFLISAFDEIFNKLKP